MSFTVRWTSSARDDLKNIERSVVQRIIEKLRSIADSPFHFLEILKGYPYYKLRVGDYRVIIDVNKGDQILTVILVGHRRKVYKTLGRKTM